MARFVLQPCRLRVDRLVPIKGEGPLELTWRELVERLAPSRSVNAVKSLYWLQPGSYVGLLRHPRKPGLPPVNFVYVGQGRTGILSGPMAQDRSFGNRIIEVYRVEKADRDSRMSEPEGTVNRAMPAGAL